ncbi:MAG: hypothetical protein HY744_03240 [Deltaproteobacteria bacterium]|nr:hypothetical protein [Deltaproteobacteria bacterium]
MTDSRRRRGSGAAPAMVEQRDVAQACLRLAAAFAVRGYFRSGPDRKLHVTTHRGYECRLAAFDAEECEQILADLQTVAVTAGTPWLKGPMWRIPVYGEQNVRRLLELLQWAGIDPRRSATSRLAVGQIARSPVSAPGRRPGVRRPGARVKGVAKGAGRLRG